ncbi:hypothetical protein GHT06_003794 [Daphnia sinensis]|uniref:Uncharacterized protein n=1 Tax=Daphnia sinensis TaxID=1820382 RepID=A0AAD5KTT0_9CRUS|nr:hypothetical protein GHT06_003794 [Daphnia sinensis]
MCNGQVQGAQSRDHRHRRAAQRRVRLHSPACAQIKETALKRQARAQAAQRAQARADVVHVGQEHEVAGAAQQGPAGAVRGGQETHAQRQVPAAAVHGLLQRRGEGGGAALVPPGRARGRNRGQAQSEARAQGRIRRDRKHGRRRINKCHAQNSVYWSCTGRGGGRLTSHSSPVAVMLPRTPPMSGARRKIHKSPKSLATTAGPKLRAGLMEQPVAGTSRSPNAFHTPTPAAWLTAGATLARSRSTARAQACLRQTGRQGTRATAADPYDQAKPGQVTRRG